MIDTLDWTSLETFSIGALWLMVLFIFAFAYSRIKIRNDKRYKYFMPLFGAKVLSVFVFCMVYLFYYEAGDTILYHTSAARVIDVWVKDDNFMGFLQVWFGEANDENASVFSANTGVPVYWRDETAFFVSRLIVPFEFLALKSFVGTSVLVAFVSMFGAWKLFLTFDEHFNGRVQLAAICALFIPSVAFWSSGILKDTVAFFCLSYVVYFINEYVNKRKSILRLLTPILLCIVIIIKVKPYIFLALFTASIAWVYHDKVFSIRNIYIRLFAMPFLLVVTLSFSIAFYAFLSPYLGVYGSMDGIVNKAYVSSQDLKRDEYGGTSFDIGNYDASISGMISRFPQATIAGLYRPFIWESNKSVVFISGLENMILLVLTILSVLRYNVKLIGEIRRVPFLSFCLIFTIIFAFSIGVSTSNFGSLVRFKIQMLPFFLFFLLFIYIKPVVKIRSRLDIGGV